MELWTQRLKLAISIWGICELYSGQKTVCACMSPFISERLSFTCNGKKINSRVLICSFTVSRNKVMNCYLYQDSSGTVKCWPKSDGWLILLLTFIYKKNIQYGCVHCHHTQFIVTCWWDKFCQQFCLIFSLSCATLIFTLLMLIFQNGCIACITPKDTVQWGIVST